MACFDLDGTLFDTSEVNFKAYEKALKENGYVLEHNRFFSEYYGKHYSEFLPLIVETEKVEIIHKIKKEVYTEFLEYSVCNKALFDLIECLKWEYSIVLCTTASRENSYELLDYYHLREKFDLIVTGDDVEKAKPDPECYLKAMENMRVKPKDTIVFEDSDTGIVAAEKSGAKVLIVKEFWKHE